jgi:hypothetical protein
MKYIKYFFAALVASYSLMYIYDAIYPPSDLYLRTIGTWVIISVPLAVLTELLAAYCFYYSENLFWKIFSAICFLIGAAMLLHEPALALLGYINFSYFP